MAIDRHAGAEINRRKVFLLKSRIKYVYYIISHIIGNDKAYFSVQLMLICAVVN